jgi:hypothetical protein
VRVVKAHVKWHVVIYVIHDEYTDDYIHFMLCILSHGVVCILL